MDTIGILVISYNGAAIDAGYVSLSRSRDVDWRNGAALIYEAMRAGIVPVVPEDHAGGIDAGDVGIARTRDVDWRNGAALVDEAMVSGIITVSSEGITGTIAQKIS